MVWIHFYAYMHKTFNFGEIIPPFTKVYLYLRKCPLPKHCDEKPDGQLWYAKHDRRLVVTLKEQGHHWGHAHRHDPADNNDDAHDPTRDERVLSDGEAGGEDAVDLEHGEHHDVLEPDGHVDDGVHGAGRWSKVPDAWWVGDREQQAVLRTNLQPVCFKLETPNNYRPLEYFDCLSLEFLDEAIAHRYFCHLDLSHRSDFFYSNMRISDALNLSVN